MKKIGFALVLIFVFGVVVWIGISVFKGGESCSKEKLQELRKEYPICYGSGTIDLASMPGLASLVKSAENYICVTVQEELADSKTSANVGFGKAGSGTIVYKNYRVAVDQIIFGDSSLTDQTLVVTINRMLPVPKMKSGDKLIIPVSKGKNGKYNLGPGSYYIAEGYVLSTFEENKFSVYTGKKVEVLIRDIKKFRD